MRRSSYLSSETVVTQSIDFTDVAEEDTRFATGERHLSLSTSAKVKPRRLSSTMKTPVDSPQDTYLGDDLDDVDENDDDLTRVRVLELLKGKRLLRHRIFCLLEGDPDDSDQGKGTVFMFMTIFVILLSCTVFIWQSYPSEYARRNDPNRFSSVTYILDYAVMGYFIIELLLRCICAPNWKSLATPLFYIDLSTIIVFLLDLFLDLFAGSNTNLLSLVRTFRLFRVIRVAKVSRYSEGLRMMYAVMRASAGGLFMLLVPFVLVVVILAVLAYFAEQANATWDDDRRRWVMNGRDADMQSILDAIWLAIVTITTTGYGDITPKTPQGKFVVSIIALLGVLTLSLPNVVLGANITRISTQFKARIAQKRARRRMKKIMAVVFFITASKGEVVKSKAPQKEDKTAKKKFNYIFRRGAALDAIGIATRITDPSEIRQWTLRGISGVKVLQCILQCYSGVATAEEVHRAIQPSSLHEIALTLHYLADADFLTLFIMKRSTQKLLVALTQVALNELAVHHELKGMTCVRNMEGSKLIWKATTGQTLGTRCTQLASTYPRWFATEKHLVTQNCTPATLDLRYRESDGTEAAAYTRSTSGRRLSHNHGSDEEIKHKLRRLVHAQEARLEALRLMLQGQTDLVASQRPASFLSV